MRAHDEGCENRWTVESEVCANDEGGGGDEEERDGAPDTRAWFVVDDNWDESVERLWIVWIHTCRICLRLSSNLTLIWKSYSVDYGIFML